MPRKIMRMPEEIRITARQKYRRYRRDWLELEYNGKTFEPLEVLIGDLSQDVAGRNVARLDEWLRAWRSIEEKDFEIVWKTVLWHRIGGQRVIPERIRFLSPQGLIAFADTSGKSSQLFKRALGRVQTTKTQSLAAAKAICHLNATLFEYDDETFDRLMKVARWLVEHPKADCYVRELPIEGVDTKWLETHIGVLAPVVNAMMPQVGVTAKNLEALWGLKRPSPLIRVRGLEDFVAGVPADAQMAWSAEALNTIDSCKRVLIVENLQTALSLKRPPGVLIIMGLGFGIEKLEVIKWLYQSRVCYFGDLDAHGLAILSLVRSRYPHVKSILMDLETLKDHQHLVVKGPTVCFDEASSLTRDEKKLLHLLLENEWRLEQERIPIDHVNASVEQFFRKMILQKSPSGLMEKSGLCE